MISPGGVVQVPHFSQAVVIVDTDCINPRLMGGRGSFAHSHKSVDGKGAGLNGFVQDLFYQPLLKRAGFVVELVRHAVELRDDRVVLTSQRICQFATEISLRSEVCHQKLHVA